MPKPVKIIVEVSSGVVTTVYASSKNVEVELLDWDNLHNGDATPAEKRAAKALEKKAKGMIEVF